MQYSFCPKCGHPLNIRLVDDIERLVCSSCSFVFYQNSKPCVSVLALNQNNELLLIKRGIEPYKGLWDLPGGFLEQGEHPLDGAIREMQEETGLLVKVIDDLGIFMGNYGHNEGHTLNFCYVSQILGGQLKAASDAAEARWFSLSALPTRIAFDEWSLDALKLLQQRYDKSGES